jgi:threonine/homoserine/homoserine lactone efflux protein
MAPILEFIGVSLVVIVTPGPDTALTIRNGLRGGAAAGVATVLGVVLGQMCWASAASLGLAALLEASAQVFRLLELLGAAYLFYLGARILVGALRSHSHSRDREVVDHRISTPRPLRAPFLEGLLSNLANPKMAIFFSSLLPPFIDTRGALLPQSLSLGLLFSTMTFAWLGFYVVMIVKSGHFLQRSRIRRTMEGVTAATLMGFAAKLANSAR